MAVGLHGKSIGSALYNSGGFVQSYSSKFNGKKTSCAITYPTSINMDSALIIFGCTFQNVPSMSSPWSLLSSSNNMNSGAGYTRCYWKKAIGNETGTLTIPFSAAIMLNIKYYTPYYVGLFNNNTLSSITLSSTIGDKVLFLYASNNVTNFTPNIGVELLDEKKNGERFSFGATLSNVSNQSLVVTRSATSNNLCGLSIGLT
jgi:hypothetical protein